MPEYLISMDKKKFESYLKIGEDIHAGKVEFDGDACNACGLCIKACPASVLELNPGQKPSMVTKLPLCIACGACVSICPEQAVKQTEFLSFEWRYRYLDRSKAEMPRRF